MSSFTPGPWVYVRGDEWSHNVCTLEGHTDAGEPSYWTVASINKRREPEHIPNARLIASAPDLLQALQTLTHVFDGEHFEHDDQREAFKAARQVIERATGASNV